ncbi:DNA polymerase II large subunit [Candidatus Micrarchaeota archaeon]|nr:DNA polymerase II large subunit [Candidatus Micrarchaeota archaeon]
MDYFEGLKKELEKAYGVASAARKKGFDPVDKVEIMIAKDVAERVEGLVGPEGIAGVIREMEEKGKNRLDIAFEIVERIAKGELFSGGKKERIGQAVRTGVSIITEGVLVAPTEGISRFEIKENPDGSEYISIYYAGPIRSAGGTASALSVVFTDVARKSIGIGNYRPTETEIARYVEEINIYDSRCSPLQYKPPDRDIEHIIKNCPICIDGEPTEEIEISVHRDLKRMETNRIRGGIALVVCEGIAQKAPKVLRYAKKHGLEWNWLQNIIKIKKTKDSVGITPDYTYLDGLVAGRPVFAYPMRKGGFRLRYGRSRTNGLMARNIHPATMIILDGFIANGTQMKVERPGKGCILTSCEGIEPPVVKLKDGEVRKVRSEEEAIELNENVEKVLFLGDMLVTYGDFRKSNHPLLPSGYCEEWWEEELKEKGLKKPEIQSAEEAFEFAGKTDTPLHPEYTLAWHDIEIEELCKLKDWFSNARIIEEDGKIKEVKLHSDEGCKKILEKLYAEHRVKDGYIILDKNYGYIFKETLKGEINPEMDVMENVKRMCGVNVRKKIPIYIGGRMGRPEKAKERRMDANPNVLFPTGSPKTRDLLRLYKTKSVRNPDERKVGIEVARYRCTSCNTIGFYRKCLNCGGMCKKERVCQKCRKVTNEKEHCGMPTKTFERRMVDIVDMMDRVKEKLRMPIPEIKGVKGLSNEGKIAERLEKGFLRAKHKVYVFRDGTCRFDATDVPLTHFKIKEIGQTVEGIKKLGYEKDISGRNIENEEQIIPLNPQDILLSEHGAEYFIGLTNFVDDLLIEVYGMQAYYNVKKGDDLLGHLVIGLAPHISAGVLGRIIGFTNSNVGYAHPYFHTAKRRNCDSDEDSVILLLDGLLNFSKKYLNERRGGTMDAPLLLTSKIDPKEVDDEVHAMEVVSRYPLEFYKAAEEYKYPGEVQLRRVNDLLGTDAQYGDLLFTHDNGNIERGPPRTKYVLLNDIPDKVEAEFNLHKKLRAVDVKNAAEKLILGHFIPDLYGNLRSFSRQTFRCVDCNTIHRRPPLKGKCMRCGGKLLLTINKGGVMKYLDISQNIVDEYDLPLYLKQRLDLLRGEIASVFEDEKIKQTGIADFF